MPDREHSAWFWPIIVADMIGVAIMSLGVHILMLQIFGVPFPDRSAVSIWASFLNTVVAVVALSLAYAAAEPRLATCSPWLRWLIVAGLFGTLKELFRAQLMNGVVTTAWIFSAFQLVAPTIYSLALGAFVVFVIPRFKRVWQRLVCAAAVAAVMAFAVRPLSALALSPLMQSIADLNHADVYPFPYGWHVLFWAYVTYLEPVAACFVAAALILPGLSPRPWLRLAQFTVLIMAIKGVLLPTPLFAFYNPLGLGMGMLSESQFLLEGLLLGAPVALIWTVANGIRPDRLPVRGAAA